MARPKRSQKNSNNNDNNENQNKNGRIKQKTNLVKRISNNKSTTTTITTTKSGSKATTNQRKTKTSTSTTTNTTTASIANQNDDNGMQTRSTTANRTSINNKSLNSEFKEPRKRRMASLNAEALLHIYSTNPPANAAASAAGTTAIASSNVDNNNEATATKQAKRTNRSASKSSSKLDNNDDHNEQIKRKYNSTTKATNKNSKQLKDEDIDEDDKSEDENEDKIDDNNNNNNGDIKKDDVNKNNENDEEEEDEEDEGEEEEEDDDDDDDDDENSEEDKVKAKKSKVQNKSNKNNKKSTTKTTTKAKKKITTKKPRMNADQQIEQIKFDAPRPKREASMRASAMIIQTNEIEKARYQYSTYLISDNNNNNNNKDKIKDNSSNNNNNHTNSKKTRNKPKINTKNNNNNKKLTTNNKHVFRGDDGDDEIDDDNGNMIADDEYSLNKQDTIDLKSIQSDNDKNSHLPIQAHKIKVFELTQEHLAEHNRLYTQQQHQQQNSACSQYSNHTRDYIIKWVSDSLISLDDKPFPSGQIPLETFGPKILDAPQYLRHKSKTSSTATTATTTQLTTNTTTPATANAAVNVASSTLPEVPSSCNVIPSTSIANNSSHHSHHHHHHHHQHHHHHHTSNSTNSNNNHQTTTTNNQSKIKQEADIINPSSNTTSLPVNNNNSNNNSSNNNPNSNSNTTNNNNNSNAGVNNNVKNTNTSTNLNCYPSQTNSNNLNTNGFTNQNTKTNPTGATSSTNQSPTQLQTSRQTLNNSISTGNLATNANTLNLGTQQQIANFQLASQIEQAQLQLQQQQNVVAQNTINNLAAALNLTMQSQIPPTSPTQAAALFQQNAFARPFLPIFSFPSTPTPWQYAAAAAAAASATPTAWNAALQPLPDRCIIQPPPVHVFQQPTVNVVVKPQTSVPVYGSHHSHKSCHKSQKTIDHISTDEVKITLNHPSPSKQSNLASFHKSTSAPTIGVTSNSASYQVKIKTEKPHKSTTTTANFDQLTAAATNTNSLPYMTNPEAAALGNLLALSDEQLQQQLQANNFILPNQASTAAQMAYLAKLFANQSQTPSIKSPQQIQHQNKQQTSPHSTQSSPTQSLSRKHHIQHQQSSANNSPQCSDCVNVPHSQNKIKKPAIKEESKEYPVQSPELLEYLKQQRVSAALEASKGEPTIIEVSVKKIVDIAKQYKKSEVIEEVKPDSVADKNNKNKADTVTNNTELMIVDKSLNTTNDNPINDTEITTTTTINEINETNKNITESNSCENKQDTNQINENSKDDCTIISSTCSTNSNVLQIDLDSHQPLIQSEEANQEQQQQQQQQAQQQQSTEQLSNSLSPLNNIESTSTTLTQTSLTTTTTATTTNTAACTNETTIPTITTTKTKVTLTFGSDSTENNKNKFISSSSNFLNDGEINDNENSISSFSLSLKANKKLTTNQLWRTCGEPFTKLISIGANRKLIYRQCYNSIVHIKENEIINVSDCVLLRSSDPSNLPSDLLTTPTSTPSIDMNNKLETQSSISSSNLQFINNQDILSRLPTTSTVRTLSNSDVYVAKVSAFWRDESTNKIMMELLWYYNSQQTELKTKTKFDKQELFASKHYDVLDVDCIEDKCYVLTFNEYCRWKSNEKYASAYNTKLEFKNSNNLVPKLDNYQRASLQPSITTINENVFYCQYIYDFRMKRLIKSSQ